MSAATFLSGAMASSWSEFVQGAACGHAVQIYGEESELAASVAAYLVSGFDAGQPGLVVATREHLAAFEHALAGHGWGRARLEAAGLLFAADAQTTLEAITGASGFPTASAIDAVVGTLLDDIAGRFPGTHVRAFGEMVDLLAARGQVEEAVSLEELWNSLTCSRPFFSLLCSYRLDVFDRDSQTGPLVDICRTHTHVQAAADPVRLAQAVDGALEDVLGAAEAGKLYTLVGREIREARVPAPQLLLMWMSENVPGLADRVLAGARARYFDEPVAQLAG